MSIRGPIDSSHFKLLIVGLESLVNDLEETLLVNLSNAAFSEPVVNQGLIELKKKLGTRTKQKVYWICKEKGIGDFPTTDLFIARLSGFKFRQIGERIKVDDHIYVLAEEVRHCEARILELGGDEQSAQKVIVENKILRAQKRILDETVHWQDYRLKNQVHVPSIDPEEPQKTTDALAALKEPVKGYFGVEVDL